MVERSEGSERLWFDSIVLDTSHYIGKKFFDVLIEFYKQLRADGGCLGS
jgi:hypothetical protein